MLGFVVLGGEQPERMVVNVKLAALFANAAFAKDEYLLAAAERVDDYSPFFERDVGNHPHTAVICSVSTPGCPSTNRPT